MRPTLEAGDVLMARRETNPPAGAVVIFPHPSRSDLWLVKRVTAISDLQAWVESDDPEATMADSRTLGWISTTEMYQAMIRYRRPFAIARL